jgi:hypothetical protein
VRARKPLDSQEASAFARIAEAVNKNPAGHPFTVTGPGAETIRLCAARAAVQQLATSHDRDKAGTAHHVNAFRIAGCTKNILITHDT